MSVAARATSEAASSVVIEVTAMRFTPVLLIVAEG